jgi:hypothetical protein
MASEGSPQGSMASSLASRLLQGLGLQRSSMGTPQNFVGAGLPAMASATTPQSLSFDNVGLVI